MAKLILMSGSTYSPIFQDVCNLFGVTHNPHVCYVVLNANTAIWGPTIFPNQTSTWANVMIADGDVIIEWNEDLREEQSNFSNILNGQVHKRITFGKINKVYVFLGVYELDIVASKKIGKLVWRRIAKNFITE